MKRKIAIVLGTLPHFFDLQQFSFLEEIYDLTLISSATICDCIAESLTDLHIPLLSLPNYEHSPSFLPGLEALLANFECVILNDRTGVCAYQVVKARAQFHFRLVLWVDNISPFPGDNSDELKVIRREIAKSSDAFLVQSDAARNALKIEGENADKIVCIAPQLSPKKLPDARARRLALEAIGLCDGDVVVSYFGSVTWASSLMDLVHAAKICKDADAHLQRRLRIVIFGEGDFIKNVQDRAIQLGIDNDIHYISPRKHAWLTVLTATSAMYYAPKETPEEHVFHPSLLVRTMLQKIPVITSRSPVIEEYLGKHRLDFCPSSILSLAQSLRKLTTAQPLIMDIVAKNRTKAEAFVAPEYALEKFQKLLEGVKPSELVKNIDSQIAEAENLLLSKQYLESVHRIEKIFHYQDLSRPQKATLYRLMGDSFTRLNALERAKLAYIKAIEIDEYLHQAFLGLGTVHMLAKTYEIAVIHFEKAVMIAPEDAMAALGLGLALQALGKYPEALQCLYKATILNPEDLTAIYSLIKLAYQLERYTEAEEVLRKYLMLHPQNHNLLFSLAGILLKQGKFAETVELSDRILDANPNDQRTLNLRKAAKNVGSKGGPQVSLP